MAVLSSSQVFPRSAGATRLPAPIAMLAIAAAGALCLSAALSPAQAASGPVVCPFRVATGLPCPGCGMTRAWVFMAHGRVGDALAANPFVLVTMPAAIAVLLTVCLSLVRRRRLPDLASPARRLATKAVVVAWLGFALVRLVAVMSGHATT